MGGEGWGAEDMSAIVPSLPFAPRAADHGRTARLPRLVYAVVQSALQKRTAELREAEVLGEAGGLLQEQAVVKGLG